MWVGSRSASPATRSTDPTWLKHRVIRRHASEGPPTRRGQRAARDSHTISIAGLERHGPTSVPCHGAARGRRRDSGPPPPRGEPYPHDRPYSDRAARRVYDDDGATGDEVQFPAASW